MIDKLEGLKTYLVAFLIALSAIASTGQTSPTRRQSSESASTQPPPRAA